MAQLAPSGEFEGQQFKPEARIRQFCFAKLPGGRDGPREGVRVNAPLNTKPAMSPAFINHIILTRRFFGAFFLGFVEGVELGEHFDCGALD